jgi:hypothetical protein
MGFLIPDSEISREQLKALKAEVVNHLLDLAVKETKQPRESFVVRDIFPKTDLGFVAEVFQNQTAITEVDTWTKDWAGVNLTGTSPLPKNKFVAFYGVIVHEQAAKAGSNAAEGFEYYGISYQLGSGAGSVLEQVHLQNLYREYILSDESSKVAVGYHTPVYYKGQETPYVSLIANAAVTINTVEIELLGMVCEQYGDQVSMNTEEMPEQTSLIVPEDDMTIEDIKALREEVASKLLALAVKHTGKPASEFVVRDILPKDDFGFNGVEWQNQTAISTANLWTKDWSKELPKDVFVAFFGVDYKMGATGIAGWKYCGVGYRIGATGNTTLKQVHLQKCQRTLATTAGMLKSARGYHRPVYYKGTQTINIQLMAKATVTAYYEQIMLLGLLCEPLGSQISKEAE